MSRCSIDVTWADGTYTLCLPLAQLEELQERCGAGPMVIAERLKHGHWEVRDVFQTLRLGLIGGGMAPPDALRLVTRYGPPERPVTESVLPAFAVLDAALFGKRDEPVGKPSADGAESDPAAGTESSTTETSTGSAA